MQLFLILGIVFTIGAVTFALQNNVAVTVVLGFWRYDSSLAVVLLVALALGALIAGLVSTPSVIKGQWTGARLRRQVASLEDEKASLERRVRELESALPQKVPAAAPPAEEATPYVGRKALMMGAEGKKPG
ncbi:MAG: lipopolysaccharide assembly protein LapA domain-containing protein [Pseudomonadota bacterium]